MVLGQQDAQTSFDALGGLGRFRGLANQKRLDRPPWTGSR
jgi:hypothetical protein